MLCNHGVSHGLDRDIRVMHTSSCDSMLSWHRLRRACDVSLERYCNMSAKEVNDIERCRLPYPMIATDEADFWKSMLVSDPNLCDA